MSCPPRPLVNFPPVPDQGLAEMRHGGREVVESPAPLVDYLRAGDVESLRDLRRTHEIRHVDLPSHAFDAIRSHRPCMAVLID